MVMTIPVLAHRVKSVTVKSTGAAKNIELGIWETLETDTYCRLIGNKIILTSKAEDVRHVLYNALYAHMLGGVR